MLRIPFLLSLFLFLACAGLTPSVAPRAPVLASLKDAALLPPEAALLLPSPAIVDLSSPIGLRGGAG